jgi:hypothetical protein
MSPRKNFLHIFALLAVFVLLSGCARQPVRHLASDACLLVPGQTAKQEVLNLMGPPDQKIEEGEQGEVWRYYQANKSLLRKTPYVGEKMGNERFDVLTVIFTNETVNSCVYRNFDEEEFEQLGIDAGVVSE